MFGKSDVAVQQDDHTQDYSKGRDPLVPFAMRFGHDLVTDDVEHGSRGNADEHRPDPPMLDPRQNEAGEARGKHDPGSKPQRRIQKPFRGPAPHEDEEGTDCAHQRDYDTTDQPLPDWTGPSQCQVVVPIQLGSIARLCSPCSLWRNAGR